jgi:hypothetical protein
MRIMTAALAAATVVAPVTLTLPAQAAQHGTVTKVEYRKIRGGMTSSQVAKVTGASGNYFYKGDTDWNAPVNERHDMVERIYRASWARNARVVVRFRDGRAYSKSTFRATAFNGETPGCATKAEERKVKARDTRRQVRRKLGTNGQYAGNYQGKQVVVYDTCTYRDIQSVEVYYRHGRVVASHYVAGD